MTTKATGLIEEARCLLKEAADKLLEARKAETDSNSQRDIDELRAEAVTAREACESLLMALL